MADRNSTSAQRLRKLVQLLPSRRRWQGVGVLGLMLLGAGAEVLTLGALVPFLAALSNPMGLRSGAWLEHLFALVEVQPGPGFVTRVATLFCVIVGVAAAIRIVLAWASQSFVFWVGHDLGNALYARLLHQSYRFHIDQPSGEVISTMGKIPIAVNGVLMPLMQALTATAIAGSILTGLILIDPVIAIGSGLVFALIYVTLSLAVRRRLQANSIEIARAFTQRISLVQEALGGIRDVLLDHAQPVYLKHFSRVDGVMRKGQATNALIGATPRFVIEAFGMVIIVIVALSLSEGEGGLLRALPVLGALALGAQRLLPLFQTIYNGWTQLAANAASIDDIIAMLDHPMPAEVPAGHDLAPLTFEKTLEFRNVGFRYSDEGPWVLRDLSFTIRKGERIGLIGRSGAGKSTTVDLIMALLAPTTGAILIDAEVLAPDRARSWQAQIAHVPQTIYLSDSTIRENIAFGVPREAIDDARVREAAAQADIAAFIMSQPLGYDTPVGERGIRISGGQRQRIGIARALYKRAGVLILDEATSALDDATAASVMRSIRELSHQPTVIVIAHRGSALRDCDRLLRFVDGQARESEETDGSEQTKASTAKMTDDLFPPSFEQTAEFMNK